MSETSGQSDHTQAGQVAGSTLIVMAGLAGATVVGIIRQRVVATIFGTGDALDAYTAANAIPELLFNILAGGALAFAFIPIYTEYLSKGDEKVSNTLLSQVLNTVLILVIVGAILVALFAPALVSAPWGIGPHFAPAKQLLVVQLMRVLVLSTIIFATSSILTGALYAHRHFILPAITPIMYSGGIIAGALVLGPRMGIFGLAWGAVFGALLHLTVQLPGAIHFRLRWIPGLGWRSRQLHRVAILMLPRIIDLFMARASIDWLNANLGSGLGEGRVAALGYAKSLMNLPWTLIGTAIGIAVFPTMSALAARKDVDAQRRALSGSLRAILTLALPAAVGLLFLGEPVIQLLYEGGEFTPESTALVFYALQFYVIALISQSILEVVVRAFAAQQDTWTPLFVSVFTTALNIGLAIWLSRPIVAGGLEHGGLALANGLAVGVESLIGLTILRLRWGGIDARHILLDVGKAALAALVMGGVLFGLRSILQAGPLIHLMLGGSVGIAVYFAIALWLGIEEIRTIPLMLIRRFTDRRRPVEA